jgi:organic radical activating enzyme
MKWNNPGHEYDKEFFDISTKYDNKEIYIYGAGMVGGRTCKAAEALTKWNIAGFIDRDDSKLTYKNKKVFHLGDIDNLLNSKREVCVIVAFTNDNEISVEKTLREEYHVSIEKIISYRTFCMHDLPIFAVYKYGKVFIDTVSIIVTERCTLRCEKCAIMLPWFTKIREYPLDKIIKEADALFQTVAFVGNLTITGGEPLLNQNVAEIFDYICSRYRKNIGSFNMISNGTLEPSASLLDVMKKNEISVDISDYTDAVPDMKDKIERHVNKYRDAAISTTFLKDAAWVDFGFTETDHQYSEKQATDFFDYCRTRCRGYVDGKIRYCINGYFASKVLCQSEDADNEFDMMRFDNSDTGRKKLVEFDLGYNSRGYLEMCQHCNGTCEINKNVIEAGKQCRSH